MVAGPVDGLRDTLALAARVEATGARAEVREGRVQGRPDYMVHIEAAASRDAARRTLRELQGQSIDGYVVADGALENAVTVGVFSEPEPAEALLARVVELGYPARQKTLERAHSVYVILSDGGALGGVTGFSSIPLRRRAARAGSRPGSAAVRRGQSLTRRAGPPERPLPCAGGRACRNRTGLPPRALSTRIDRSSSGLEKSCGRRSSVGRAAHL